MEEIYNCKDVDEEKDVRKEKNPNDNCILTINNENEKATLKQLNDDASTVIEPKHSQLALSRIKTIMKLDPDLGLVSKDSLILITKATVVFICRKRTFFLKLQCSLTCI